MLNRIKKYLTITFLAFLTLPLVGQESIIKDFAEPRRSSRWLNPICFYPSVLRMINISQNPQYNELVKDIEKVLIYTLDSATNASKSYTEWLKKYEEIGYEQYVSVWGKQEIRVIGKKDEYVGVLAIENKVIAFYLRGEIPFEKIPLLMQTFQSDNLLPMITEQFK